MAKREMNGLVKNCLNKTKNRDDIEYIQQIRVRKSNQSNKKGEEFVTICKRLFLIGPSKTRSLLIKTWLKGFCLFVGLL